MSGVHVLPIGLSDLSVSLVRVYLPVWVPPSHTPDLFFIVAVHDAISYCSSVLHPRHAVVLFSYEMGRACLPTLAVCYPVTMQTV